VGSTPRWACRGSALRGAAWLAASAQRQKRGFRAAVTLRRCGHAQRREVAACARRHVCPVWAPAAWLGQRCHCEHTLPPVGAPGPPALGMANGRGRGRARALTRTPARRAAGRLPGAPAAGRRRRVQREHAQRGPLRVCGAAHVGDGQRRVAAQQPGATRAQRPARAPPPLPSRGRAAPAGACLPGSLGARLALRRLVQPAASGSES